MRPFLIALGYLLGRFDAFQLLGTFNRMHLARLLFGARAVEESVRRVGEILDQWGYRGVLAASTG